MPLMRRAALVLLATLSSLAMAACSPERTFDLPTPSASISAPPFATEDEALIAATESVTSFYQIGATILTEGGVNGERLNEFATPDMVAIEMSGFDELRDKGLVYRGQPVMTSVILQSYLPDALHGIGVVTAYVCQDGSSVTLEDANGTSLVSPSRTDFTEFQITFDLANEDSPRLLVSSKTPWGGGGVC